MSIFLLLWITFLHLPRIKVYGVIYSSTFSSLSCLPEVPLNFILQRYWSTEVIYFHLWNGTILNHDPSYPYALWKYAWCPRGTFKIFLLCESYNIVLTERILLVSVRCVLNITLKFFVKVFHVDPESRPQNFMFIVWIIRVHKDGHIYEQKQQALKNNILKIKNLEWIFISFHTILTVKIERV